MDTLTKLLVVGFIVGLILIIVYWEKRIGWAGEARGQMWARRLGFFLIIVCAYAFLWHHPPFFWP